MTGGTPSTPEQWVRRPRLSCDDGPVSDLRPMLATMLPPGDVVPTGPGWVHEVKWDGVRALVEVGRTEVGGDAVRVRSRNGNDVTPAYPELEGLAGLGFTGVLDGEVIALGSGVPSLASLEDRIHVGTAPRPGAGGVNPVTLIVFDLLLLDGEDLFALPLAERRELLLGLGLDESPGRSRRPRRRPAVLAAVREQQLEGS